MGDIAEEFDDRLASGRTPRRPKAWANVHVLKALLAAIVARSRRLRSSTRLAFRDAVRAIRSAPGHSLFVVLVLCAGITLATVTFSVVDAVLLKPLPVREPERLVQIPTRNAGQPAITLSRLREAAGIEAMAPFASVFGELVTLDGKTESEVVMMTTSEMFEILGMRVAVGRAWTTADESSGNINSAVVSHRYWREHLGASADALGRTLDVFNRKVSVLGVLENDPARAEFGLTSADIWVPIDMPSQHPMEFFAVLARTKPGVSANQIATEVARVAAAGNWRPEVRRLLDSYASDERQWMMVAMGAALLIVCVACANAANLMLTRTVARVQEMAIRTSLGASRAVLAWSIVVEGLLLSLAATAAAWILAIWGVRLVKLAILSVMPGVFRASSIALNGRVLVAAIACAVATGVLFSMVPAWQVSRTPFATLLKDADSRTLTGRRGWRSVFLVAEIASVVVLLVASWLFVLSLIRASSVDLGLETTHLAAVNPRLAFRSDVNDAVRRVRSVPGVVDVATTRGAGLPIVGRAFGGAWITTSLRSAESSTAQPPPTVTALNYFVTSNYFAVAGLPFERGSSWPDTSATGVAVIDERAARLLFGTTDVVGRTIVADKPARTATIVGIVPHVSTYGAEDPAPPSAYFPIRPEQAQRFATLLVRTAGPSRALLQPLSQALAPVAPAPNEPIVFAADDARSRLSASRRFNASLMSIFGLAATLLGAAGVYAVMTSFVSQQTRELGVRAALGASPGCLQRGVLSTAARHVVLGFAIGVPVAYWVSRGFSTLLFQVTPADVSVYVVVAFVLVAMSGLAAWLPARRAARVDPMLSLRR